MVAWLAWALAADCAVVDGEQLQVSTPFAFASRSTELIDDAPVREVLCYLEADPARTVQIEVHTDSQGSSTYNQRMSQQRADAIREAIRKLGVAEGRVTSVGYGETMPIASNRTADGRATNRRIELYVTPPSERPPAPPPIAEPRPQPAGPIPAPRPPPPPRTLCEQLDHGIVMGEGQRWTFEPPVAAWVEQAKGCLSMGWDIDDEPTRLVAYRSGWQVTVEQEGDVVVVALKPR